MDPLFSESGYLNLSNQSQQSKQSRKGTKGYPQLETLKHFSE